MRILLVDDDPQILKALRITLSVKGYDILTATDGAQAIEIASSSTPDMMIVDLGMPRLDGISVIEAVRGWSDMPILVVSGRGSAQSKIEALDAGADDYVTKPFLIEELLARIRALGRRIQTSAQPASPQLVTLGEITIDCAAHTVTRPVGGKQTHIRLTPTEWKVLEILVKNPSKLVTRRLMLEEIWGTQHAHDTGYLRLYISQLRKKLEPDPANPRYILTDSGMGYRLEPNG